MKQRRQVSKISQLEQCRPVAPDQGRSSKDSGLVLSFESGLCCLGPQMRNGTVMELEKAAANGVEYHPQAKAANDFIGAALKLRAGLRRKEGSIS